MTYRFCDLLDRPDVEEAVPLRSHFGFMAFHGGPEAHTECLGRNGADMAGASVYTVVQPATLGWHVPSHHVVPSASERLARFLEHVDVAVSVHRFGGRGRRGEPPLRGRHPQPPGGPAGGVAAPPPRPAGGRELADNPPAPRGPPGG